MQVGAIGAGSQARGASPVGQRDQQLESIRDQMEEVKKQIKQLGQKEFSSPEEKLQRQKDLQERLSNLQQQYTDRQRQIQEQRAQKAADGKSSSSAKEEDGVRAVDNRAMSDLVRMDSDLKLAHKFDRVEISLEGREHVLKKEVEADAGEHAARSARVAEKNGGPGLDSSGVTQSKLDEMTKVQAQAQTARGMLAQQLGEVNDTADADKKTQDGVSGAGEDGKKTERGENKDDTPAADAVPAEE